MHLTWCKKHHSISISCCRTAIKTWVWIYKGHVYLHRKFYAQRHFHLFSMRKEGNAYGWVLVLDYITNTGYFFILFLQPYYHSRCHNVATTKYVLLTRSMAWFKLATSTVYMLEPRGKGWSEVIHLYTSSREEKKLTNIAPSRKYGTNHTEDATHMKHPLSCLLQTWDYSTVNTFNQKPFWNLYKTTINATVLCVLLWFDWCFLNMSPCCVLLI